jgi:hypothetical protein
MRNYSIVLLALALAACAPMVQKVDGGNKSVGERLVLKPDSAWNELTGEPPAHVWTLEGVPIDRLLIYSGIKDGEAISPKTSGNGTLKSIAFRSSMQGDEIVAMFEGMLTRDQSTFTLVKLEPAAFGGGKGVRFQYELIRKADNVPLAGAGYAVVDGGQLFAVLYNAPRLAFFPRHRAEFEHLAQSARVTPLSAATAAAARLDPSAPKPYGERPCVTITECQFRDRTK